MAEIPEADKTLPESKISAPKKETKPGGVKRLLHFAREFLLEHWSLGAVWSFLCKEAIGVKNGWVFFTAIALVLVMITHKFDVWYLKEKSTVSHSSKTDSPLNEPIAS